MACPHCSLVTESSGKTALLSPVLAEMAQALVYKSVKAATLHRLAELWAADTGEAARPLLRAVAPALRRNSSGSDPVFVLCRGGQADRRGQARRVLTRAPHPEMALSAKDTVLSQQHGRQAAEGMSVLQLDQVRSASA